MTLNKTYKCDCCSSKETLTPNASGWRSLFLKACQPDAPATPEVAPIVSLSFDICNDCVSFFADHLPREPGDGLPNEPEPDGNNFGAKPPVNSPQPPPSVSPPPVSPPPEAEVETEPTLVEYALWRLKKRLPRISAAAEAFIHSKP